MSVLVFINNICKYFSIDYIKMCYFNIYNISRLKENYIEFKCNKNKHKYFSKKEICINTLYHNLTYDHGICLLDTNKGVV